METEYLGIAIQYYVAGRSATFAGSIPVAGNLFHHAVEMLLKFFLLKHYSPIQLKQDFRHDLEKLWLEFKKIDNESALGNFDELVSALNEAEDLRFPEKGYVFIIELRKGSKPQASGPATKGLKQYHLNLEEIDQFVTALLSGRVTSGWIRNLLRARDARVQYKRENFHPFFTN